VELLRHICGVRRIESVVQVTSYEIEVTEHVDLQAWHLLALLVGVEFEVADEL